MVPRLLLTAGSFSSTEKRGNSKEHRAEGLLIGPADQLINKHQHARCSYVPECEPFSRTVLTIYVLVLHFFVEFIIVFDGTPYRGV